MSEGDSYTDEADSPESAAENATKEEPTKTGEEEEEKKEPEPEPEPEPDPLEGLTYDDDGEAPLPPYGDLAYWEQRYTDDIEVFEWYQDPEAIIPHLKGFLDGEGVRVLVLGTGNSDLAPQIAQSGIEGVVAVDFAKPAIVKSRKRNREIENISWKVMDVRKLTFGENEFPVIVDKGTLDCLFFVGEADVNIALAEIARVLKRGGRFVCVSYAPPEYRKALFHRPSDLRLELENVIELAKPLPTEAKHYIYILKKIGKVVLKK
jgi:ubiquinone/menaquinone biosynthesis C-methylase UbiE